ncbi:unnamed protein product [Cladocopium goreaui]|uniref:Flavodoxin-like domain-containing protein n=1 Tax=Cladocopium goreaui TaxID=2562237 RepID=A0A9P1FQ94_9DINO|nr:unnamed protein product [Cladocopium goreaui]
MKRQPVQRKSNENFNSTPALPIIRDLPPEAPTSDDSDVERRRRLSPSDNRPAPPAAANPSAPVTVPPRPSPSLERAVTVSSPAEAPPNPVVPPRSSVNHHLRPWTGAEDHELVTFKSDARARPAWKTIGFRLKRDPEACKACWLVLRQNMPGLNPRTEPEAEGGTAHRLFAESGEFSSLWCSKIRLSDLRAPEEMALFTYATYARLLNPSQIQTTSVGDLLYNISQYIFNTWGVTIDADTMDLRWSDQTGDTFALRPQHVISRLLLENRPNWAQAQEIGPNAQRQFTVTEIDAEGTERLRRPEFFFHGIVGHVKDIWGYRINGWKEAARLANYWRRYFDIEDPEFNAPILETKRVNKEAEAEPFDFAALAGIDAESHGLLPHAYFWTGWMDAARILSAFNVICTAAMALSGGGNGGNQDIVKGAGAITDALEFQRKATAFSFFEACLKNGGQHFLLLFEKGPPVAQAHVPELDQMPHPSLYYQAIDSTFQDPSIFEPVAPWEVLYRQPFALWLGFVYPTGHISSTGLLPTSSIWLLLIGTSYSNANLHSDLASTSDDDAAISDLADDTSVAVETGHMPVPSQSNQLATVLHNILIADLEYNAPHANIRDDDAAISDLADDTSVAVETGHMPVPSQSNQLATVLYNILIADREYNAPIPEKIEDFEDETFSNAIEKSVFFILVSSTYGAGSAPPSAAKFLAWLRNNKAGNSAVVVEKKPYGIIGLGDSSYPRFCAAVDIYETLLLDRGAGPCLLPSAKCNAKLNEEISFWDWVDDLLSELSGSGSFLKGKDPMLENLISQADAEEAQKTIPNRRGTGKEIKFEKKFILVQLDHGHMTAGVNTGRCQAKVLSNDTLQDQKGHGVVSRVTIDKGPRQEYFAGDEIQIFAQNSDKDVEIFAKHFDALPKNLDNQFLLSGSESDLPLPNTHRYILKRYIALHDELMFSEIQVLACLSDDANLKRLVLDYDAFNTFQIHRHVRWLDMFNEFPALWGRISVEILYQVAPRIRPRYYSISSAPHSSPNLVVPWSEHEILQEFFMACLTEG